MPRTPNANQEIRDQRRTDLLHAAAHAFARKGPMATKVADIAAAANVSHGLAYHYFASKEEIFRELISRAMQGTEQIISEATARKGTVTERLRWLITEMIEGTKDSADDVLLVQQALINESVPADIRALVRNRSRIPVDLLGGLLREGQKNGEIVAGDADQLALLLLTCIQGIFSDTALSLHQFSIEPKTLLSVFLTSTKDRMNSRVSKPKHKPKIANKKLRSFGSSE